MDRWISILGLTTPLIDQSMLTISHSGVSHPNRLTLSRPDPIPYEPPAYAACPTCTKRTARHSGCRCGSGNTTRRCHQMIPIPVLKGLKKCQAVAIRIEYRNTCDRPKRTLFRVFCFLCFPKGFVECKYIIDYRKINLPSLCHPLPSLAV